MKLSIIIPVFNEEKYIQQSLEAIVKAPNLEFQKEIIIINDGSTDSTLAEIKKTVKKLQIKNKKTRFILINKKWNEGKGQALKEGFLQSTGDIVLVQDADLEYSAQDYPNLLDPFLKANADVVYGSRFISYKPHRVLYFWHFIGNLIVTSLSNILTNLNLTDMETGFKLFKGPLIRSIAPYLESKRFGFEPEITAKIAKIKGIKIYEVGISYWGRTYEEGKKIKWIDGVLALWQILKYNLIST